MLEELEAVKVALMTTLPVSKYRTSDIFIARSEDDIPSGVKAPCFGIKDGQFNITKEPCEKKREIGTIFVICWAPTEGRSEEQVVGRQGVLEMAKAVVQVLDNNLLQLQGLERFDITGGRPSLPLERTDSGKQNQQLVLIFEYERIY